MATRYIVFGGGCFGAFYVRQLRRAAAHGAVELEHVLVLDRDPACRVAREHGGDPRVELRCADWTGFGTTLLALPEAERTHWVPAPLAPHVLFTWLVAALGATPLAWPEAALPRPTGLPFAEVVRGTTLALSHAPGMCPVHCIEPRRCPLTRTERDWEMRETVTRALGHRLDALEIFECAHHAFGVGTIEVAAIQAAHRRLELLRHDLRSEARVGVATVSGCHGIVDVMALRAAGGQDLTGR